MTPKRIQLVKSSFAKIAPVEDQTAALFYRRLFELDPDLRALFRGDMATQGAKLMAALGAWSTRSTSWRPLCRRSVSSAAAMPPTASAPSTMQPSVRR
jgi:hemoglobin-like flavoprotein